MTERPVFVISTGRTGTRFLARFFAEHGGGTEAHHTTAHTRLMHVLSNLAEVGLLPSGAVRTFWERVKLPTVRAAAGRYVECNPYYYKAIPFIWESFPEARIVFVVRDPRDFIRSHIQWERQRWQSRIANQLIPFCAPLAYHQQLAGLLGRHTQRVGFYARVWARKNAVICAALGDDPRGRLAHFEEIFGPGGAGELTALLEWLEMPLTRPVDTQVVGRRVNVSDGQDFHWREAELAVVRRECAPLAARLGYDL